MFLVGGFEDDGVVTSSDVLFFTVDLTNVSVNELNTGVVVEVVIPGSDPSRLLVQFVLDLFEVAGGDISEMGTMSSTEHDGLVVGKWFRAQQETRNGSESEEGTEESSLDSHDGGLLTRREGDGRLLLYLALVYLFVRISYLGNCRIT